METSPRYIAVAAFATPHGAARAAAAVIVAHPGAVVRTAVAAVARRGAPGAAGRGWVPGRGALVSGVLGLIGGPLAAAVGSPAEAFTTALRDSGVDDAQLQQLGAWLREGDSVLVLEIEQQDAVRTSSTLRAQAPLATVALSIGRGAAELFERVDDSICTPSAA